MPDDALRSDIAYFLVKNGIFLRHLQNQIPNYTLFTTAMKNHCIAVKSYQQFYKKKGQKLHSTAKKRLLIILLVVQLVNLPII